MQLVHHLECMVGLFIFFSSFEGPAKSLKSAQYLVEQRVGEEEAKRLQQGQQIKGSALYPLPTQ